MPGFLREHSRPIAVSLLFHGVLAGVLLLMTSVSLNKPAPPAVPIPITAVVVDSQVLHAAQRAEAERVAQEAARVKAVTQAEAAAVAKADNEARAAKEAQAAAAQAAADAKAAEQERSDAAAANAEKAAEVAAAKQAAGAKQAADAKQAVEAKQAADAKRVADDRARQDREAELRRQLADEEHRSAVEAGPLRDRYIASLQNRIQKAWIRPPSARVGIDCQVEVTQVPGGEVTNAHVTECNGDAAVRQSIENAVYRASPLPDPPDPALFERNFVFRFKPSE